MGHNRPKVRMNIKDRYLEKLVYTGGEMGGEKVVGQREINRWFDSNKD